MAARLLRLRVATAGPLTAAAVRASAVGKGTVKAKRSQDQPGPSSGRRGLDGRRAKKKPETEQSAQPVKKKRRTQTTEERKVVVTPGQRAKWQPLPESSRAHLESMMRGLILAIVYETPQNQKEVEKHLNQLKERLVRRFKTLRVPLETQSHLKDVKKLQAEEEKNIAMIKEGLIELQEAIDKSVEEAELRDEETARLENKIQALKRELEEMMNELSCKESDVLALPKLQKESLEAPVLQEVLLKIPNQEGVLRDLNKIQQSEEMRAMLDSLEQAYENADEYDEVQSEEENLDTEQQHGGDSF